MAAVMLQQFTHADIIYIHNIVRHCCSNTCSTGMEFYIYGNTCKLKWHKLVHKSPHTIAIAFDPFQEQTIESKQISTNFMV